MASKSASAILSQPRFRDRNVQRMASPMAGSYAAGKSPMGQAPPQWAAQNRQAGPPGAQTGIGGWGSVGKFGGPAPTGYPGSGIGSLGGQFGAMNPAMGRPGAGGGMGGGMTIASPLMTSPAVAAPSAGTQAPASVAAPAGLASPYASSSYAASTSAPGTGFSSPPPEGVAAGGGLDPWGYPTQAPLGPKVGRKGKKKFGGHGYSQRAYRKLPPWLLNAQNEMFGTTLGSIQDILNSQGKMSPERMIQEQSDIEAGRGQGQQALAARLAQSSVDPSSPMYQSMAGTVDQAANRMQAENRRAEDIRAEMQKRQDLNLVIPYLQAILGLTTKKGGGGVSAAPVGGGGGSPDYLGAGANIAGSILGGWAQGGFQT